MNFREINQIVVKTFHFKNVKLMAAIRGKVRKVIVLHPIFSLPIRLVNAEIFLILSENFDLLLALK